MKKLIIIPAYNEEKNLDFVISDILEHAPEFDYVIINDGSTDGTEKLCRARGYNIINLPINLGIGGCVQTGYIYAKKNNYDFAVQIDGDGQHSAKDLNDMYKWFEKDPDIDMVLGSRYIENEGFQSTGARRFGIKILSSLIYMFNKKRVKDVTSGLRMVNRTLIEMFAKYYPSDYPEPETIALALRRGCKIKEVPAVMRERQSGKSSINPKDSIYYMLKVSLAICLDSIKPKKGE